MKEKKNFPLKIQVGENGRKKQMMDRTYKSATLNMNIRLNRKDTKQHY